MEKLCWPSRCAAITRRLCLPCGPNASPRVRLCMPRTSAAINAHTVIYTFHTVCALINARTFTWTGISRQHTLKRDVPRRRDRRCCSSLRMAGAALTSAVVRASRWQNCALKQTPESKHTHGAAASSASSCTRPRTPVARQTFRAQHSRGCHRTCCVCERRHNCSALTSATTMQSTLSQRRPPPSARHLLTRGGRCAGRSCCWKSAKIRGRPKMKKTRTRRE